MEVVDLGTRFEVSVDPQSRESNVSVIEGLVDLHLGSHGTERMIRPLEAGYAARVDASGKIIEITNGSETRPTSETDDARILAHWTFDELSADGKVQDATGSQLGGILRAGKAPDLVPGVSGQALVFTDNASVDLSEHVSTLAQLDAFDSTGSISDSSVSGAMSCSLGQVTAPNRMPTRLK